MARDSLQSRRGEPPGAFEVIERDMLLLLLLLSKKCCLNHSTSEDRLNNERENAEHDHSSDVIEAETLGFDRGKQRMASDQEA